MLSEKYNTDSSLSPELSAKAKDEYKPISRHIGYADFENECYIHVPTLDPYKRYSIFKSVRAIRKTIAPSKSASLNYPRDDLPRLEVLLSGSQLFAKNGATGHKKI